VTDPLRRVPRLGVIVWLVATLALTAAFWWSSHNPVTVEVSVDGPRAEAVVNGVRSIHQIGDPGGDRVGLFLGGAGPAQPAGDHSGRPIYSQLRDSILLVARSLDATASWTDVRVTPASPASDPADWTPVAASHWFVTPGGGLSTGTGGILLSKPLGATVSFAGTLTGDSSMAGVLVSGRDNGDGSLFLFRPLHGDAMWWEIRNGGWIGPFAGVQFERPWPALLKSVVYTITKAYLAAMAIAAIAGAIAVVVSLLIGGPKVSRTALGVRAADLTSDEKSDAPGDDRGRTKRAEPGSKWATVVAWMPPIVVALIGFGVTAYIASEILERMPHVQDSVAYYFQAKTFALGRLWVPVPQLPEFFWHEFVVMADGKWYSKYPPGFPAILAAGVVLGYPWLVNPVLAGVSLLLVFLIGRQIDGVGQGILASVLLLSSPFFLFLSGSFMAHTAGMTFALLFVFLWLRSHERPTTWVLLLTGASFGIGFLIRPWSAIAIAAPFGAYTLLHVVRNRRPGTLKFALIALGAVPFVLLWLQYNAILTGNPLKNTMEMWWSFDRIGFGPDIGLRGHHPGNALYNLNRNLTELVRHAFGWPQFATLAIALVPFATGRANRNDWLFLSASVALITAYFFWWADGIMYGPRFYFELMGFLVLLSARGAFTAADRAREWLGGRRLSDSPGSYSGRVFVCILIAGLLAHNLSLYLPEQFKLHRGYNFVNRGPVNAVERAGIRNALVFVDVGQPHEWWNYGMVFSSNDPQLEGDVIYARDLGPDNNRRLRSIYPDRGHYQLRGVVLQKIADHQ
jgi:hypothetical protein